MSFERRLFLSLITLVVCLIFCQLPFLSGKVSTFEVWNVLVVPESVFDLAWKRGD
jgi:hypothetical protein